MSILLLLPPVSCLLALIVIYFPQADICISREVSETGNLLAVVISTRLCLSRMQSQCNEAMRTMDGRP